MLSNMFSLLIGECYIEVIGQRPKQVMGLRVSFPHSKRLCRVYTSSTLVKSKDQRNGDLAELKGRNWRNRQVRLPPCRSGIRRFNGNRADRQARTAFVWNWQRLVLILYKQVLFDCVMILDNHSKCQTLVGILSLQLGECFFFHCVHHSIFNDV